MLKKGVEKSGEDRKEENIYQNYKSQQHNVVLLILHVVHLGVLRSHAYAALRRRTSF